MDHKDLEISELKAQIEYLTDLLSDATAEIKRLQESLEDADTYIDTLEAIAEADIEAVGPNTFQFTANVPLIAFTPDVESMVDFADKANQTTRSIKESEVHLMRAEIEELTKEYDILASLSKENVIDLQKLVRMKKLKSMIDSNKTYYEKLTGEKYE